MFSPFGGPGVLFPLTDSKGQGKTRSGIELVLLVEDVRSRVPTKNGMARTAYSSRHRTPIDRTRRCKAMNPRTMSACFQQVGVKNACVGQGLAGFLCDVNR